MTPNKILEFWFADENRKKWFWKSEEFDQTILQRFQEGYEQAMTGAYDVWQEQPTSCVALVILLDQFSRNMFRGTKRMYAADSKALSLTHYGIQQEYLNTLKQPLKKFLLMPLMHSESMKEQQLGIELFSQHCDERTLDAAQRHLAIVAQFGRFPHRNEVLQRQSTQEELEFLKTPGSRF